MAVERSSFPGRCLLGFLPLLGLDFSLSFPLRVFHGISDEFDEFNAHLYIFKLFTIIIIFIIIIIIIISLLLWGFLNIKVSGLFFNGV